jgi:hypothetical protein
LCFVEPRTTPQPAAVPCALRVLCLGLPCTGLCTVVSPCWSVHMCTVAVRAPVPKAESSPEEPFRRPFVRSVSAAASRCQAPHVALFDSVNWPSCHVFFSPAGARARCGGPGQVHPSIEAKRHAPAPCTLKRCRALSRAAHRALVTLCAHVRTEDLHLRLSLTQADPDPFLWFALTAAVRHAGAGTRLAPEELSGGRRFPETS